MVYVTVNMDGFKWGSNKCYGVYVYREPSVLSVAGRVIQVPAEGKQWWERTIFPISIWQEFHNWPMWEIKCKNKMGVIQQGSSYECLHVGQQVNHKDGFFGIQKVKKKGKRRCCWGLLFHDPPWCAVMGPLIPACVHHAYWSILLHCHGTYSGKGKR